MTIRICFFSLFFLAIFASLSSVRADDLDKATTHGEISIQLPKDWTAKTSPEGGLTASSPTIDKEVIPGIAGAEFRASLSITIKSGPPIDAAAQQKMVAKSFKNYRPTEPPAPYSAGALKGATFGGSFTLDDAGKLKLHSLQYFFSSNEKVYIITFTTLDSRFAAYRPLIESSVATFSLSK